MGILFILAGIIFLITTMAQVLRQRSFENNGAVCTAQVADRKTGSVRMGHKRVTTYRFLLSYNVDGTVYTAELPVSEQDYNDPLKTTTEIYYNKINPKKILSTDTSSLHKGIKALWIVTFALFAVGTLMLLFP